MRIAVVGSGGREHALGWKIKQSPLVETIVGVPGNAGWRLLGPVWTDVDPIGDQERFVQRCLDERIDLVVVGPEAPLVAGLADALRAASIPVFGPGREAARLEGSKAFAKRFMARHGIPTAAFDVFDDLEAARAYLHNVGAPIVIKADGLAAGKGVVVAETIAEAEIALREIFGGAFGEAGTRVVIEERLAGEEASVFVLLDESGMIPLLVSQDHKRAFDDDQGPNTGGMGAYAPTSLVDTELWQRIQTRILEPLRAGLATDGLVYRGVLYVGLMIVEGDPYVLEFNVRFGDPECQPLMLQMNSDLVPLLQAVAEGCLAEAEPPEWRQGISLCVIMASGGYPGPYNKGIPIPNLRRLSEEEDRVVFQAGTAIDPETGEIVTAGGRVLGVTAHAPDATTARRRAYELVERLAWPGCHYRTDIGLREVEREIRAGRR